jgi:clan AA aspartic protease (TIGR02281 family)
LIPDTNGGYNVSVNFEGQLTINMMFDTGAHLVLLKKEHFESLLAEGKIKGPSIQTSSLDAGGNINPIDVYILSKLTIGKYEIHNVACAINKKPTGAPNLLGMSAIRKLGKSIKIDLENNYLEVNQ